MKQDSLTVEELTFENALLKEALTRLLGKFHIETDCGTDFHWAECELAVNVLGAASYEDLIDKCTEELLEIVTRPDTPNCINYGNTLTCLAIVEQEGCSTCPAHKEL